MKIDIYTEGEPATREWSGLPQEDLLDWQLEHSKGGGPWVMLQDMDPEYCRLVDLNKDGDIGSQAFLAWKPMLSRSTFGMIPETAKAKLNEAREEIKSGVLRIVQTHISRVA